MTELSDDDLDLLRAEGCLVDMSRIDGFRSVGSEARDFARTVLRAVGMVPGSPSLDLLAAAIERRGWRWMLDTGQLEAWVAEVRATSDDDAVSPGELLALALCQAIRSLCQEDRTDG